MNFFSLIPGIGPVVEKILGLIPDVNERARAEAEFNKAILDAITREGADNREINKAEAAHSSVFVSGWRPFFGWIGGAALAFNYLIRPFWVWAVDFWFPGSPVPPALDGMLWELVFGMLGIGGLRTIEKWKGVAR
jgi:hypothetical protein